MKCLTMNFFLLAAVFPSQASSEIAECYSLSGPQDGVAEMVMRRSGNITFTLPDAPQILFFLSCAINENDSINCQAECDGGDLMVTHTPKNVRLDSDGIRIDKMRFDSVLRYSSKSGAGPEDLRLKGNLVLRPADSEKPCLAMENRTPNIELQAGDMNVMVKSLEQNLIDSGYMTGTADIVFDAKTRAALILWQADAGLNQSGKAGPDVRRQLATDSALSDSGCQN